MHLSTFQALADPMRLRIVETLVEFHEKGQDVRMVLTFDAMHDEEWTRRMSMGHESQLGKFERVIASK